MFKLSISIILVLFFISCSSSNNEAKERADYQKQLFKKANKAYETLNKELE